MALLCLIPSKEWDFPIFKKLANNDTGSASGHQGGVVIPKDLRQFFPGLSGTTSDAQPTIDTRIEAELFAENFYKSTVSTRYQFQTWGGTRSPESRLTDQLGVIRSLASENDYLIIQRNIERLDQYKLTLVRKSSPDFAAIDQLAAGRRWGILTSSAPVLSEDDLKSAINEAEEKENIEFKLFDETAIISESTTKKVARSVAFRSKILGLYKNSCAVCNEGLQTPTGLYEVDAAHIVPRAMFGQDDARNGLALCKRHHWAFDKGLFGVGDDRKILIPTVVSLITENSSLIKLRGLAISEADNPLLKVNSQAFKWHRENLLLK